MRSVRTSIFITVAVLVAVGIVMIYSASAIYADSAMKDSLYFLKRHMIYVALGFAMMILAMSIDLSKLRVLAKPLMLTAIALLVLVLVPHIGRETSGARRWFRLGMVNFQPSEFVKIAIILYMADFISRKEAVMKSFTRGYLPAMAVLGLTVGLVLIEPDLGTAVTISLITIIMLYAGGLRSFYILLSFFASLPVLYALLFSVSYRRKRMLAFLNPWADRRGTGFQIIQSFAALS